MMESLNFEEQLDEETKEIISKMEKEIESKNKEINDLKNQLAFLQNQVLNKNKKIFGKSSEQLDSNQMSFFDEAEKYSDAKAEEPTIEQIIYNRKKPSSYVGKKDNLANLDRIVIEHKLENDKVYCSKCDEKLVVIGSKSKEILKYQPAKLYIEEHITYSYACNTCEDKDGTANIVSTKAPDTLLHKGMASNEVLAHVICLKYQFALPLYRQESYFDMLGVTLSRQTLSNWIMGAANEFKIVYDLMKERLLESHYLQADETTVVVVDPKGSDLRPKNICGSIKQESLKTPLYFMTIRKQDPVVAQRNF
jgi:transposase